MDVVDSAIMVPAAAAARAVASSPSEWAMRCWPAGASITGRLMVCPSTVVEVSRSWTSARKRVRRDGTYLDFKSSDFEGFAPTVQRLGKKVRDVVPPEVAELTMRHIELALETGAIQTLELKLPVEGVDRDYEARIAVSGEGEVMVIVRDITDRKEAHGLATELALKPESTEGHRWTA